MTLADILSRIVKSALTLTVAILMHALVSISMACLLLLQTLSGCWWQRVHECDSHAAASTVLAADCGCTDCQDEDEHQGPCKNKIECRGVCSYLGPEKAQSDSAHDVAAWDLLIVASTTPMQLRLSGQAFATVAPQEAKAAMPLYLTQSVLLI